ncbi:hypothetical protein AVME950_00490 [Acidovorax sp. SUPP950]|uniref:hypothetical protein n=1 Tax=Acidovorax sp. SUPP950 TaxID=511901 RepID=UPI0023C18C89|nr:hypothetical protein [Acidovorax sp. SUPP950]GKS73316.1 hypothetical protein AVME950_00490 [Acidovorax sp. SUPP950]
MTLLDLRAPIIAGRSAAGFRLGMSARELDSLLDGAVRSRDLPVPINAQLATGRTFVVTSEMNKIRTIFFGEDVRLSFNEQEELYCIGLAGRYQGLYLTRFGIGTLVKDLDGVQPLEFDDSDEMNYPKGQLASGVSFGGACSPLEVDPNQRISYVTVHNWSRK